jgi:hypothetical protein
MLTKIALEDSDGREIHSVPASLVETDDPDARQQAIVWNDRVFVSVDIPDCDAPKNYDRHFYEVPVAAHVNGDDLDLVKQLARLAKAI